MNKNNDILLYLIYCAKRRAMLNDKAKQQPGTKTVDKTAKNRFKIKINQNQSPAK